MAGVYQNIRDKKPLFDKSYEPNDKAIKKVIEQEDVIVRNLKLLSYELLSDYVNGGFPVETIKKRKLIQENVDNVVKAPNASVLFNALEKADLTGSLSEHTIVNLF